MAENKDPKTQILNQIQDAENVLVTVNGSPSVDELTSALGLTLLINKLGKRCVAVVSGDIPDALEFLQPKKTFESSIDSLRDFIVALNKEKADHLRYKIEGDYVKVFITPYRTKITEKDLEFSQGEYNVDFIIALNVETQDKLDAALKAHGQILHNATVSTITNGVKSSLGTINWEDDDASCLCEMIVGLASALKQEGDGESLMDEPIATALLTGIVSATNRFSNEKTNSLTMAIASKLMQFGADQQLVSTNLDKLNKKNKGDILSVKGGHKKGKKGAKSDKPNELVVDHEEPEEEKPDFSAADAVAEKTVENSQAQAAQLAEQKLSDSLAQLGAAGASTDAMGDLKQQTDTMLSEKSEKIAKEPEPLLHGAVSEDSWRPQVAPFAPIDQPVAESFLPPTKPVDMGQPAGGDPTLGQTTGLYQENKHGYVAPISPDMQPLAPPAPAGPNYFGGAPIDQPAAPVAMSPDEAALEIAPAATTPAESPFIPPAPPPAPTVDANSGLPMPPGVEQPLAAAPIEEAMAPVTPAPIIESPAMPAGATTSPIIADEVYPATPTASDVGSFQIPGQ